MGIFGDLTYSNTRPRDLGLPVDAVKETNASLDKAYKENRDKLDAIDIALAQLDMAAIDEPVRQQQIQSIKDQLAGYAERGDYERAGDVVRMIGKEVETSPEILAALQRKKTIDTQNATLDEKYTKGAISKLAYDYEKAKLDRYSNTALADMKIEGTNRYDVSRSIDTRATPVNIPELMNKLGVGFGSHGWASDLVAVYEVDTGMGKQYLPYTDKNKALIDKAVSEGKAMPSATHLMNSRGEKIDAQTIQDVVYTLAKNDPAAYAFLQDEAKIRNEMYGDNATAESMLLEMAMATGQKYAASSIIKNFSENSYNPFKASYAKGRTWNAVMNPLSRENKIRNNPLSMPAFNEIVNNPNYTKEDIINSSFTEDEKRIYEVVSKRQLANVLRTDGGKVSLSKEDQAIRDSYERKLRVFEEIKTRNIVDLYKDPEFKDDMNKIFGSSIPDITKSVPNNSQAVTMFNNMFNGGESVISGDKLGNDQYNKLVKYLYNNKQKGLSTFTTATETFDYKDDSEQITHDILGVVEGEGKNKTYRSGQSSNFTYFVEDENGNTHSYTMDQLARKFKTTRENIAETGIIYGRSNSRNPVSPTGYEGAFMIGDKEYTFRTEQTSIEEAKHYEPLQILSKPEFDGKVNTSDVTTIPLVEDGQTKQVPVISKAKDTYDEFGNYKREVFLYKVTGKNNDGTPKLEAILDSNGSPYTLEYAQALLNATNVYKGDASLRTNEVGQRKNEVNKSFSSYEYGYNQD